MKRILSYLFTAGILTIFIGCALPGYSRINSIESYYDTSEWYKPCFFCADKSRSVTVDFRNNRIEDKEKYLADLRGKVEEYILRYPETAEETKAALKRFSVITGMTKEQVKLVLGNPEKVQSLNSDNKFKSDERWVYIDKGLTAVQIGPVPIFFTHNANHLYFRDDVLTAIESVGMDYL